MTRELAFSIGMVGMILTYIVLTYWGASILAERTFRRDNAKRIHRDWEEQQRKEAASD